MVVFNHFMYESSRQHSEFSPVALFTNKSFSFLVNPTFIFVSGITSQGAPTYKRVRRFVQFLVVPAWLWHAIAKELIIPSLSHLDAKVFVRALNFHTIWETMLSQSNSLPDWYLVALIIWRGSSYAVWSHLPKSVSLSGMIMLSCLAGYYELPKNLNHTFSYFPLFGLGYYFPLSAVERVIQKPNKWTSMCVVLFILVYTCFIMPTIFPTIPGSDEFTGVLPDAHGWFGSNPLFRSAAVWDYRLWWCRRLSKLLADMIAPLMLIFLVLPREETWLTYAGSHTLYSYLGQGVPRQWVFTACAHYQLGGLLTGTFGQLAKVVLYIPVSIVVFVLLTSSYWRCMFSWALTPQWLDSLVDPLENRVYSCTGTTLDEKGLRDSQASVGKGVK